VTEAWLHECLDKSHWVSTAPYLHPRFDRSKATPRSKPKKQPTPVALFVAVGDSSNPSKEIVQALGENWRRCRLVSSPTQAEFVVIGE
jgi:hypothetical protein